MTDNRADQVIAELLEAATAGKEPDREEVVARHPDLADERIRPPSIAGLKVWLPRLLAFLVSALLLAAAPPAGPSGTEVGRLIEQLGDDDFDTRERATERLKLAGEPALDALHKALSSDDLEVRRRARTIVAA